MRTSCLRAAIMSAVPQGPVGLSATALAPSKSCTPSQFWTLAASPSGVWPFTVLRRFTLALCSSSSCAPS